MIGPSILQRAFIQSMPDSKDPSRARDRVPPRKPSSACYPRWFIGDVPGALTLFS